MGNVMGNLGPSQGCADELRPACFRPRVPATQERHPRPGTVGRGVDDVVNPDVKDVGHSRAYELAADRRLWITCEALFEGVDVNEDSYTVHVLLTRQGADDNVPLAALGGIQPL